MKLGKILSLLFIAVLALCVISKSCFCSDFDYTANWNLVWYDEFNTETLDSDKWGRCVRGTSDWNDTMSTDPALITFNDGVIVLHGIVNPNQEVDPAPYLTAGIISKNKFAVKYGKILVRAKFESATGAWPAIWMTGIRGAWPENGEIDMMEHLNNDNFVHQNVHSVFIDDYGHDDPQHHVTTSIDTASWNVYGCEWTADKIVYTVNGKHTLVYPRVDKIGSEQWPFCQPFSFIISMQIGGTWVGAPISTEYPVTMSIDWIRVYTKKRAIPRFSNIPLL